jgi:hypothetical protein
MLTTRRRRVDHDKSDAFTAANSFQIISSITPTNVEIGLPIKDMSQIDFWHFTRGKGKEHWAK